MFTCQTAKGTEHLIRDLANIMFDSRTWKRVSIRRAYFFTSLLLIEWMHAIFVDLYACVRLNGETEKYSVGASDRHHRHHWVLDNRSTERILTAGSMTLNFICLYLMTNPIEFESLVYFVNISRNLVVFLFALRENTYFAFIFLTPKLQSNAKLFLFIPIFSSFFLSLSRRQQINSSWRSTISKDRELFMNFCSEWNCDVMLAICRYNTIIYTINGLAS